LSDRVTFLNRPVALGAFAHRIGMGRPFDVHFDWKPKPLDWEKRIDGKPRVEGKRGWIARIGVEIEQIFLNN
jgi:hypothetical protein